MRSHWRVGATRVSDSANPLCAAASKKLRRAVNTGGSGASGLASSVAFTPVQGLELVNPDAAEKKAKEANDK